jgi:uncharacterized membrane protein YesL
MAVSFFAKYYTLNWYEASIIFVMYFTDGCFLQINAAWMINEGENYFKFF